MMNLADEFKSIKDDNNMFGKYSTVVRVLEKYNDLLSRGLIKEEGRKVATRGELDGFYMNGFDNKG
jgi:hypothetical protein